MKTLLIRVMAAIALPLAALVALSVIGVAHAQGPADEKPVIDVTKDPGCGKKLHSDEEKIAHNRKLAQIYFQSYSEAYRTNKLLGWDHHGCFADNWTLIPGTYDYDRVMQMHSQAPGKAPDVGLGELQANWKTIPDLRALPGTLVIYPSPTGAFFRMKFGGTAKTGEKIELWEIEFIQVNDEGKITLWEFWDDTVGVLKEFDVVWGHFDRVPTMDEYTKMLQKRMEQSKAK